MWQKEEPLQRRFSERGENQGVSENRRRRAGGEVVNSWRLFVSLSSSQLDYLPFELGGGGPFRRDASKLQRRTAEVKSLLLSRDPAVRRLGTLTSSLHYTELGAPFGRLGAVQLDFPLTTKEALTDRLSRCKVLITCHQ